MTMMNVLVIHVVREVRVVTCVTPTGVIVLRTESEETAVVCF